MKLLITMLSLSIIGNVFAGTLENRRSGESIRFDMDHEKQQVVISSTSMVVQSTTVAFSRINGSLENAKDMKSDKKLFGMTEAACGAIISDDFGYSYFEGHYPSNAEKVEPCLIFPVVNIPGVIVGAVNVVILPFVGTAKLLDSMRLKGDFKKLSRAVKTNSIVRVNGKRFQRLEEVLKTLNP